MKDEIVEKSFVTVRRDSDSAFKGESGFVREITDDIVTVEMTKLALIPRAYLAPASNAAADRAKTYEEITVYAVHETNDDRGSLGGCLGFFTSQSTAKLASVGHGYYGGDGRVVEREAIRIKQTGECFLMSGNYPGPIDVDQNLEKAKKEAVKRALSKLTDNDIEALGLKKEELL